MKILIVDDSRVMRQIVTRTLRQAGYSGHDVVEAGNGREGLDAVAAHGPDLVLSDWNMPEMNGIDLLHALRATGQAVPFGFVTSEGSPEMLTRAEQAGALFVITKPFTPEAFRATLDPVIG
ncbi:MAG TPA: response regulator [Nocardioidaceae bacterium]|nr:response regulator [Nocardioidaceae bacterium]